MIPKSFSPREKMQQEYRTAKCWRSFDFSPFFLPHSYTLTRSKITITRIYSARLISSFHAHTFSPTLTLLTCGYTQEKIKYTKLSAPEFACVFVLRCRCFDMYCRGATDIHQEKGKRWTQSVVCVSVVNVYSSLGL